VDQSIRSLLNPELTASWEKGLTYVAQGSITSEDYMKKLEHFVRSKTHGVMGLCNQASLAGNFQNVSQHYKGASAKHRQQERKKNHAGM
jgi:DNA topoisomerase-3